MALLKKISYSVRRNHRLYTLVVRIKYTILPRKQENLEGVLSYDEKREVIKNYATNFSAHIFLETGTYKGDTPFALQNYFDKLISIELDKTLYEEAKQRFAGSEKIKLLQGDSGKIMPTLLNEINEKIIFWLDGHYSGGETALGEKRTPIIEELEAIANHTIKNHIILIDDARLFVGKNDYPDIQEVRAFSTIRFPNHICEVKDDIIRIVPK